MTIYGQTLYLFSWTPATNITELWTVNTKRGPGRMTKILIKGKVYKNLLSYKHNINHIYTLLYTNFP